MADSSAFEGCENLLGRRGRCRPAFQHVFFNSSERVGDLRMFAHRSAQTFVNQAPHPPEELAIAALFELAVAGQQIVVLGDNLPDLFKPRAGLT